MAVKSKESVKITQQIKCPYCGVEYRAYDIFIPQNLIGKGTYGRDEKGQITNEVVFEKPVTIEQYLCDKCNQEFTVETDLRFIVKTTDNSFTIAKKGSIQLELEVE